MKRKIIASLLTLSLVCGITLGVAAATEHWNDASTSRTTTATHLSGSTSFESWANSWDSTKTNFQQLAITPGKVETQLNFGWYSQSNQSAAVRISKSQDMSGATVFDGTATRATVLLDTQYYANKVTVSGLSPDTKYYYQYRLNSQWQPVESFTTGNPEKFTFLYVGDPQIGASKNQVPVNLNNGQEQTPDIAARNDSYNWAVTLNAAVKANPNLAFILSAGDQVNEYARDGSAENLLQQEYEYAGFLSPNVLRSLPVATTIGNHDASSPSYKYHFNNPNPYQGSGGTAAGNGHYYTYGNALFIMLNINNYNCAEHRDLIDQAVKSAPDATWRIVTIHQDIYGTGLDHSDSDGIVLRTQLTPIFDEFGIDVVLQGHDHTYSRSYHLTGDAKAHTAYDNSVDLKDDAVNAKFLADNLCYTITDNTSTSDIQVNPTGTLYLSANSATGSKFYELIPTKQDYIARRSQTWTPTYSVISIDGSTFTVSTYDVATGNAIDSGYTIVKSN